MLTALLKPLWHGGGGYSKGLMIEYSKDDSFFFNCTICNALLHLRRGGGCSFCLVLAGPVYQRQHWEGNVMLAALAQVTAAWA
jgi:hypothetical protein